VQLTDVTLGGFATILDNPTGKDGCCEVAAALLPRVEALNDRPINPKSKAWKRLAMQFFPSPARATGWTDGQETQGQMYSQRRLRFKERGQMAWDFGDE